MVAYDFSASALQKGYARLAQPGDVDSQTLVALTAAGYAGPACFELSRHSHDAVRIATRAFAFVTAGA